MAKVLITGGKGFIGRYLSRMMRAEGWYVVDADHNELDVTRPETFDWLRGANFDAIVHLAALLMIDGNKYKPVDYFKVNTIGTFNVLEFCRKEGIPTLIYAMTHSDVNARGPIISPHCEHSFVTGSWENNSVPFISSKIAAADMIESYSLSGVIRGVILRLANIRGYGSRDEKYNCVFHQFIQKALRGESIEIWGDPPKTVRDLIYVKDVCSAIMAAISEESEEGYFNIGSGVGLTIEDEAKAILKVFGKEGSGLIYRSDIPEVRKTSCVFDTGEACLSLGWAPEYDYVQAMMDYKKEAGL
jgi:UDP-glucose 4-epimerase